MSRRAGHRIAAAVVALAAACGGDNDAALDGGDLDGATAPDATNPDAATDAATDAAPDASGPPLPGFGAIMGQCGVVSTAVLDADQPVWFEGELTFAERYDDPADRGELTTGGLEIILDGNAGGSSLYSEVFAFEWLARCELATLLKTENEIVYDVDGKKADLLVELDGRKIGVSVFRAVTFPFGDPYTLAAAAPLIMRKLDDLALATAQVGPADLWSEQMVVALAYDVQHAQVLMQAWDALDATSRGQSILVVAVTSGDDLFIYTDQ